MNHMAWEFSPINIQKRNQLTLFNMLNIITLQHNADTLCQKSDNRKFQELSHKMLSTQPYPPKYVFVLS
jgi:hypothetical protein